MLIYRCHECSNGRGNNGSESRVIRLERWLAIGWNRFARGLILLIVDLDLRGYSLTRFHESIKIHGFLVDAV